MVVGLPFDLFNAEDDVSSCDGDDSTTRLDTTVVSDNDDDDDDCCYDSFDVEVHRQEFQQVKKKTADLMKKGRKAYEEFGSLLEDLEEEETAKEEDDSAASVHNDSRVSQLSAILDQIKLEIKESKKEESDAEQKLIESTAQEKTYEIKKAIKEKEIQSVVKFVSEAESVDLAFVVDATSSMIHHIQAIKQSIRQIVRDIQSTSVHLKLRLAVVVYRDLEYIDRVSVLDFVQDVTQFEQFVGKIVSVQGEGRFGPRDTPEDIAVGVQQANLLSWMQPTRVVYLIADSPCHGVDYHDGYTDHYPNGTPGISIVNEMKALVSNASVGGTMTLFFGRITGRTDRMVQRFQEHGINLDVVDAKSPMKIAKEVTKGVRSSIFKTLTATAGGGKTSAFSFGPPDFDAQSILEKDSGSNFMLNQSSVRLKPFRVVPGLPSINEWQNQPAVPVRVYKNTQIKSITDLQKPVSVGMMRKIGGSIPLIGKFIQKKEKEKFDQADESFMFCRRSKEPFAQGNLRIAYHDRLARTENAIEQSETNVVLKAFKYSGKGLNERKQYFRQMEVSTIASFLAKEYNKSRPISLGNVHVLGVCVVEEEANADAEDGTQRFCVEEALSDQSFTRYSSNAGSWNVGEMHETLLRFTMFTHEITKGYLLVSDLQGVQKGRDFYLTDPAILCTDIVRFGHTNLGQKFLHKCLDSTQHHMKEKGWH